MVGDKPVELHITACYGVDERSGVNLLGKGSVVIFYTTEGNVTWMKGNGGIPYLVNKRQNHQNADILGYTRILDTIHLMENNATISVNADVVDDRYSSNVIIPSIRHFSKQNEIRSLAISNKRILQNFLSHLEWRISQR